LLLPAVGDAKGEAMVSAWWLLVALWLGGCIGFLLATVLTVSKESESSSDPQGREAEGRLAHRRH
jgi:hypothetical protein